LRCRCEVRRGGGGGGDRGSPGGRAVRVEAMAGRERTVRPLGK
jgi:hypothetical protein